MTLPLKNSPASDVEQQRVARRISTNLVVVGHGALLTSSSSSSSSRSRSSSSSLHDGNILFARSSPRALPQLTIPIHPDPSSSSSSSSSLHLNQSPSSSSSSSSASSTPDTPRSLSSPISGVIDLTHSIKTLDDSPITEGAFSDIFKGEWTREIHVGGGMTKKETTKVAIKLLRVLDVRGLDNEKAQKRLNREVYVWHRLEHPNIVQLFGTSYHMAGRPSMVMQWYENGSAHNYLRDHGNVDRVALVRDVAHGLKYLHTSNPPIIHGDLKSNNVLITNDGSAVLSDFGLSQVIDDLLDRPPGFTLSNMFGPIRWQAPELLEDEDCRPGLETDVWGFGCTAYELLTGNIPYHYRSKEAMVMKDMRDGIKPPGSGCFTGSDGSIEDVLDRYCWSFCPSARLRMTDIASHVERICDRSK